MTPVVGCRIGSICLAALSVSHSLTQNITMSTGPMVFGSSVALTLGRRTGCDPPPIVRPPLAHPARVDPAGKERKTAAPFAGPGPKHPTAPPGPIDSISSGPPQIQGREYHM